MHALREHRAVKADLAEAFHWYEDQRPGLGYQFAHAIKEYYALVRQNPTRNAIRFDDIRRLNLKQFPYGIFYIFTGEVIVVLGVLHAKRDTRAILERRRVALSRTKYIP